MGTVMTWLVVTILVLSCFLLSTLAMVYRRRRGNDASKARYMSIDHEVLVGASRVAQHHRGAAWEFLAFLLHYLLSCVGRQGQFPLPVMCNPETFVKSCWRQLEK
jgi:hypothetical protein